jgi:hypothetical protein
MRIVWTGKDRFRVRDSTPMRLDTAPARECTAAACMGKEVKGTVIPEEAGTVGVKNRGWAALYNHITRCICIDTVQPS